METFSCKTSDILPKQGPGVSWEVKGQGHQGLLSENTYLAITEQLYIHTCIMNALPK